MSEDYKNKSKNNEMEHAILKAINENGGISTVSRRDLSEKETKLVETAPANAEKVSSEDKTVSKDENVALVTLSEIYGDKTPPKEVREMLGKLKGNSKIESYLDIVRKRVKENANRKSFKNRAKKIKNTETSNKLQFTKKETKAIFEETGIRIAEALEKKKNGDSTSDDIPFKSVDSAHTIPDEEIKLVDNTNIQDKPKSFKPKSEISNKIEPIEKGWIEYTPDKVETTSSEGTRAEEYAKLKKAIDYVEMHKIINTAQKENLEGGELFKRLEKATTDRSKELSNKSEELFSKTEKSGAIEKMFRTLGERYNKLGLKSKIAVGLSLGVGTGVASAFGALGITAALLSGVAVQRTAGMASVFLKFEKKSTDTKWKKEKAMGKAMLYTAGMTGAMLFLSAEVKDYVEYKGWGDPIHNWLGHMLGHENIQGHSVVSDTTQVSDGATIASGAGNITHTASNEGGAEAFSSQEIPNNDVIMHNAPKFMQPNTPLSHMPGVLEMPPPPPMAPEIATATVAHIPTNIEMPTVNASTGHGYEYMVKRLWEDLHKPGVVLPSHIDPHSDLAKLLEANKDSIDGVVHRIASDPQHGFFNADGTSISIDPSSHMTIEANGQIHFGDITNPEGALHSTPEMQAHTTPVYPQHTEAGTAHIQGNEVAHTPPTAESAQPAPSVDHNFITNEFGLKIPTGSAHIYADWHKHILVYGGSPDEKSNIITDYLSKNPHSYIYSASDDNKYRIPWHLLNGKAVPETPVQTNGVFGFFKTFMKAPDPEELRKFIK